MSEIEQIVKDHETKAKWEELHHKFGLLMDKDTSSIMLENFSDESLNWWIEKSISWELYNVVAYLEKEKKRRTALHFNI